jgi:uncharacterized protein (DUF2236 family)
MPSSPDESFGGAVTRRIWTDVDNLLLVFVGSAAEFALVGENHWLFYTMALPSAPWDRFLSTLAYNRKIFLTPKDKVPALAQAIRGIHTRVEEKRSGDEGRATAISNGAFKAVGAMLIDYGIAGYAYLHRRPLSDAECEAHYQDERAFFALMGITDLEADYPTYRQNRETVLRDNLHVNAHTRDLFDAYRRELGAFRMWILCQFMAHFVPPVLCARLGLRRNPLFTPCYRLYPYSRRFSPLLRRALFPKRVRMALDFAA